MKNIILIALLLSIFSCDRDRCYEEYKHLDNNVWNYNEPVLFKVLIDDTLSNYNLFAGIRNTELYKYMNLYVFMTVKAPNGMEVRDTIEFILANVQGKWIGNRGGDFVDNRVWFKKDYKLDVAGEYTFEFQQAMRDQSLTEISDFGLRIEKSK